MSNEYKMLNCPFCGELPIITKHHREEMYNFIHRCEVLGPISRDFREDPMAHVEMWNIRVAASPQPPALGGEPEVLGYLWQHRKGAKYGTYVDVNPLTGRQDECDDFSKTEMIDRAHLAPLQAELKSAIADKEAYGQNAIDLRKQVDQLTARRNALEGLLQMFIDNSDDRDVVELSRHALSKPAGSDQAPPLEIPSRTIMLSGCEFTEDELLRRAVRAVRGKRRNTYPRWALVRDAFGCGSGVGTALCRRFGFDPEEILKS